MLRLCERSPKFAKFKPEISNLIVRAIGISKQLKGWLDSAINSEIKGVKYLTEKERERYQRKKENDEFDREMTEFRQEFQRKLKAGGINKNRNE